MGVSCNSSLKPTNWSVLCQLSSAWVSHILSTSFCLDATKGTTPEPLDLPWQLKPRSPDGSRRYGENGISWWFFMGLNGIWWLFNGIYSFFLHKNTSISEGLSIVTYFFLVGGIPTPLNKYESHLGWWFPTYGKMKHVPNHQLDCIHGNIPINPIKQP